MSSYKQYLFSVNGTKTKYVQPCLLIITQKSMLESIFFFSFLLLPTPCQISSNFFHFNLPFFFFVITKMEEKICIVLSISNSFILLYFQRTFAFVALNLPSTDFHLMYRSFISCYLSYIVCVCLAVNLCNCIYLLPSSAHVCT